MKTFEQVKKDVLNGAFEFESERVSIMTKGSIIDPNQTVVWNEQEVEKHNIEALKKRHEDRVKKNELHEEMVKEITEALANETSLNVKQAELAFERAWSEGHSSGMFSVFGELEDIVILIEDIFKAA